MDVLELIDWLVSTLQLGKATVEALHTMRSTGCA
jgi:hypothetical protein